MRVPEPTEKCAVCAASPIKTRWSADHGSVRMVGNCRQMLRFVVHQPWARKARYFGVADDEFNIAAPVLRGRGTREASARV